MTLKTIKIDEVIYNKLLERKREHESIADVIAEYQKKIWIMEKFT
jgi:predicted CopG family antitoxin